MARLYRYIGRRQGLWQVIAPQIKICRKKQMPEKSKYIRGRIKGTVDIASEE